MTSSLNSPPPEPVEVLRRRILLWLEGELGALPEGLVVAPCRVEGYHFYSNAPFLVPVGPRLLAGPPPGMELALERGFLNIRLGEALLREAVETLAAQYPGDSGEGSGLPSRLRALLALREEDRSWGPAGARLAWLIIKGADAARLSACFEEYFRGGRLDHRLLQALAVRLTREV